MVTVLLYSCRICERHSCRSLEEEVQRVVDEPVLLISVCSKLQPGLCKMRADTETELLAGEQSFIGLCNDPRAH